MSTLDYALVIEGLDKRAEAVRSAFSKKLSEIPRMPSVCSSLYQSRYKSSGVSHDSGGTIRSALPHLEGPESLKTLDGTLKEITEAVEPTFLSFEISLSSADKVTGWRRIIIRPAPGGAWCVEVPYDKAVAIYVDYQPNINRSFETAHILGDAFLDTRSVIFRCRRRLSETRYELIGRL